MSITKRKLRLAACAATALVALMAVGPVTSGQAAGKVTPSATFTAWANCDAGGVLYGTVTGVAPHTTVLVKIEFAWGAVDSAVLGVTDRTQSVTGWIASVGEFAGDGTTPNYPVTLTAYANSSPRTGNNIDPGDTQIGEPIVIGLPACQ